MASPTLCLSGPMTGYPNWNFPAFHEAAAKLRAAGYQVVNPAETTDDPNLPWEHHMRRDIRALLDCDGVATLPNWSLSRGAALEVHVAFALSLTVMSVKGWLEEGR